jgi:hypothetical protein
MSLEAKHIPKKHGNQFNNLATKQPNSESMAPFMQKDTNRHSHKERRLITQMFFVGSHWLSF